MVDIPFIKDPTTLQIIQALIDTAGTNFQPPYSGGEQPYNAVNFNDEGLLQYDLPAGVSSRPTAEPAVAQTIGTSISFLLTVITPIISAYGLLLPILGVIRGILEVICAMMNPFAVIRAVIRLFKKWIPAFIALFPTLAGIIILISTIKAILAIIFYILSELVATYELIKSNIELVGEALRDENTARADAGREKLKKLLLLLLNKLGILAVLIPIVDLLLLILGLNSGFPCGGGGNDKANASRPDVSGVPPNFDAGPDSTCCGEDVCPDVIKAPPSNEDFGNPGRLLPGFFGEFVPGFVYYLYTNNPRVAELNKFNNSVIDQLNPQLDEEINQVCPPGVDSPCPMFKVKITSRRGTGRVIETSAVRINGTVITIFDPAARRLLGQVNYEIVPNYEMLIMQNMIGLGCHPDVEAARNDATPDEDLDLSLCEKIPEACEVLSDVGDVKDELDGSLDELDSIIDDVDQDNFNAQISKVQALQDNSIAVLSNYSDRLRNALNTTLAQVSNKLYSEFEVDKNLVKADGQSIATLSILPKDGAGAIISRNLPEGVDINVTFITDFGIISNQRIDSATGEVLADIVSATPGVATCQAKVNTDFVSTRNNGVDSVKEIQVRFVADAALPVRRKVSTPSQGKGTTKSPTGSDSEREPRN